MFNDFLMETQHFIKILRKQKVKTFFSKRSYCIKHQVGTTLNSIFDANIKFINKYLWGFV